MRKIIKRLGSVLLGAVGLVLVAGVAVVVIARGRLAERHVVESPLTAAAIEVATAARGRHVADIHGCHGCHGEGLAGRVFLDIPPGLIVAPNLTSGHGGVGHMYTERDWDRAVRFGVAHDGRALLPFMPSPLYHRLADDDAAALAAYLEQLPPRDHVMPATKIRLPGYAMLVFGGYGKSLPGRPAAAPARAATAEYGRYLASTTCSQCHGEDLRGGSHPAPAAPPAPDLMPAGLWPAATFAEAVQRGRVGPRRLTHWMPSEAQFAFLDSIDLDALHAYLREIAQASTHAQSAP